MFTAPINVSAIGKATNLQIKQELHLSSCSYDCDHTCHHIET